MESDRPMDRLVCGDVSLVKPRWQFGLLLRPSTTVNKSLFWCQQPY
jgi:hypothetical protein